MSFTFTGLLSRSDEFHSNSFKHSSITPFCNSDFPPGFSPAELLNHASLFFSSPNSFNLKNSSSDQDQQHDEKEGIKKFFSDPSFETQAEHMSLFQSPSSIFEEKPLEKQGMLEINELVNQTGFSTETRATKFEYPSTQNLTSELALTRPETHGNPASGSGYANYANTSQPSGEQSGSGDGYHWRKYGEKHVKESENLRCYYRCSQPNCSVKKQVEKVSGGHIAEIVYKGKHNHPKPDFTRRTSAQLLLRPSSSGTHAGYSDLSVAEEDSELPSPTSFPGGGEDELEPEAKRRKLENENGCPSYPASWRKNCKEPRVVVQTTSEIDILDDGYRWRKYGQKAVKGNPNPRSYYKCVAPGCSVRKHVERAANDVKAVLTTYEGKHNHDVPEERGSTRTSNNIMNNNGNNIFSSNVTAPTPIRPVAVTKFASGSAELTNPLPNNDIMMQPPPPPSPWPGIENFDFSSFRKPLIGDMYNPNQEQNSLAAFQEFLSNNV